MDRDTFQYVPDVRQRRRTDHYSRQFVSGHGVLKTKLRGLTKSRAMSVFVVRSPRQRSTSLYSVPVVLQGGEDATKELLPRKQ